jgi:hypothetical protein
VALIPVPEVVEHGRTRIVVERHVDLASAVADVDVSTAPNAGGRSRSASRPAPRSRATSARCREALELSSQVRMTR